MSRAPAYVGGRRSGKRAAAVRAWCEANGITVHEWQDRMIDHYWGPPTDQEYLLRRLNTRWANLADPGPWQRDRMKR